MTRLLDKGRADFVKGFYCNDTRICGGSSAVRSSMAQWEAYYRCDALFQNVLVVCLDFNRNLYYMQNPNTHGQLGVVLLYAFDDKYLASNNPDRVIFDVDGTDISSHLQTVQSFLRVPLTTYSVYNEQSSKPIMTDLGINFDGLYWLDDDTFLDRLNPNSILVKPVGSQNCPRCSTLMIKKTSPGLLYSGPVDILKCPKCNYCV